MGFDSAMTTTLNFIPDYAFGIQRAIRENRVEEAQKLQDTLSAACYAIIEEGKILQIFFHIIYSRTELAVHEEENPFCKCTYNSFSFDMQCFYQGSHYVETRGH